MSRVIGLVCLWHVVAFSILSEVVVVSIDATAEGHSLNEPLAHDFISAVERYVKLEEAGVGDREPCLVHVLVETHLMAA